MERRQYNPEEQKQRDEAAKQIIRSREEERADEELGYDAGTHRRGLVEYAGNLKGINHFFGYIKSLSPSKAKLLDIGTGYGRAVSELAEDEDLNYNLDIIGTSLRKGNTPEIERSEKVKFVIASAESLKPIQDEEISGIISVFGIGHSKAPELIANSVNRVLVPSGVLKTCYMDIFHKDHNLLASIEAHKRFEEKLRELGFDVAIYEEKAKNLIGQDGLYKVLTAIKPPIVGVSARMLMEMDLADAQNQMDRLIENGHSLTIDKEDPDETEVLLDTLTKTLERFFKKDGK